MKTLLHKSLTQFVICTVIVLLLATPLFYLLTKYYYAEDLLEIVEAAQNGHPLPATDLEEDLMEGMVLQFVLIGAVLIISLTLMLRLISKRLWHPFDDTLSRIERFSLEGATLPPFISTDVEEFARLNRTLTRLMENNLRSYKTQREFTENASHELQTPLAVIQGKLDLLLQQPGLTESQAEIVQSLYEVSARLSRLNRNLLLLAKIDNNQYRQTESIDIVETVERVLTVFTLSTEGLTVREDLRAGKLPVQANKTLLESLINNLVVNAIRHNITGGEILFSIRENSFSVSNTSSEEALNPALLFRRFNRPSERVKGNGLGLAIVKAICDYHGWKIEYQYENKHHTFVVTF